jgi:predicted phosphodiesterase
LEAVAAEVIARRPDATYVLGDLVNGCAWPDEVLAFIRAQGWPMLLGNHDDAVLQLGTARMEARYADQRRYGSLWWTRSRLSAAHLALIEGLPLEYRLADAVAAPLRLIHGVPGDFFVGFRPDSPEAWVLRCLSGVSERTVVGGHSHAAMARRLGQWHVVNSGSVGAPYDGDVRASYVWLEGDRAGWRATVRRVAYDLAAVDAAYHATGLADAANVLGEMFHRSVMSGQPWVSDFAWWLRLQPAALQADVRLAQTSYDATYGPGRWAFPYVQGA